MLKEKNIIKVWKGKVIFTAIEDLLAGHITSAAITQT